MISLHRWLLAVPILHGLCTAVSQCPVEYDKGLYICCQGVFQHRPPVGTVKCCRTVAYVRERQVCCGGVVSDRPTTNNAGCCGTTGYDLHQQLCCPGNNVVSKPWPYRSNAMCCGSTKSYNPKREVCCEGMVHHLPCPNTDLKYRCCGQQMYDSTIYDCCEDHAVTPKGCCNLSWDPSTHMCCGGVVTKAFGHLCCGGKTFTTSPLAPATCCQGVLWPFDFRTGSCCGCMFVKKTSHKGCCGGVLYDPTSSSCCWDEVHESTKYCIDGEVHATKGYFPLTGDIMLYDAKYEVALCGKDEVDLNIERCCQGKIRTASSKTACCGLLPFSLKKQLCCNRIKIDKTNSSDACCGDVVYTPGSVDKVCCEGQVHQSPNGSVECCGSEAYNSSQSVCLCGTVHTKSTTMDVDELLCCASTPYNPAQLICCLDILQSRWSKDHSYELLCCGRLNYSPLDKFCCAGVLYDKDSGFGCCNEKVYDTSGSLCCPTSRKTEEIFPVLSRFYENQTCCDDDLVKQEKGLCCNTKDDQGDFGIFHPFLACRSRIGCCAGVVYNMDTEKCCVDQISPIADTDDLEDVQCCGKVGYSVKTELCCRDSVQPRLSQTTACCGGLAYEPATQVCCTAHWYLTAVHPKVSESTQCCYTEAFEASSDTQCCFRTLYNASVDMCCAGAYFPTLRQLGSTQECCGSDVITPPRFSRFDPKADLCCDGVRHAGAAGKMKCCGMLTMDPESQICCNGRPHAVSEGFLCCGCQVYNPVTQICCGDTALTHPKVFDSESGNKSCCGRTSYHLATQVCCEGRYVLHQKEPLKEQCCGNRLYNTEAEVCCDLHIVQKVKGYKCCGRRLYNPKKKLCCEGVNGVPYTIINRKYNGLTRMCCGRSIIYNTSKWQCCNDGARQYVCKSQNL